MTVRRHGVSLVELLLASVLLALLLLGLARFAAVQGRLAERSRQSMREADALRTTALVLGRELRYVAAADLERLDPQRLRLRAFRGGGRVCRFDGEHVVVSYSGMRNPNAGKDSALFVTSAGRTIGARVRYAGPTAGPGCPAALRLRLDQPVDPTSVWTLVFESGEYHLAEGALRYRIGRGGRQPITETILEDARVSEFAGGSARISLRLRVAPLTAGRQWTIRIAAPGLHSGSSRRRRSDGG